MASERSKTTNSSCPVVNTHTMLKKVKKSSSYQFKLNYFSDFRALWNSRDCYKYVLRRSCEGLFAFIFPTIFFLKEFCSNVMVLVIYCKIWNFIITFFSKGGGRGKMEQQLNVTSCAKKVKSQNFQISLGNVVCVGHTG